MSFRHCLCLLAVYGLAGCGARQPATSPKPTAMHPTVQRVAVLRCDDQTGGTEWLDAVAAVAPLLAAQAPLSSEQTVFYADNRNAAALRRATHVVECLFAKEPRQVRLHAVWEEVDTQRNQRHFTVAGSASAGLLPLVQGLAQQVWQQPQRFTATEAALRELGAAYRVPSVPEKMQHLRLAVAAAPQFFLPQLERLQGLLQSPEPTEFRAALSQAQPQSWPRRAALQRNVLAAQASGDRQQVQQALQALTVAMPADGESWLQLAQVAQDRLDYRVAAQAFTRSADLLGQPRPLLQSAYNAAYASDWSAARSTLDRYTALVPADANAYDSRGEILYLQGQFEQAAQAFSQSFQMNPNFLQGYPLWKAAHALLAGGKPKEADKAFGGYLRHLGTRQPAAVHWRGYWMRIRGKGHEAEQFLAENASLLQTQPLWAARAGLLLAQWRIEENRPSEARDLLAELAPQMGQPALRSVANLLLVLADGDNGLGETEKWVQQGEPKQRKLMLALPYTLNGRYAEAAPLWRELMQQGNPMSRATEREWHAWCLVQAGKLTEARAYANLYWVPQPDQVSPFTTSLWPLQFAWRAKAVTDAPAARQWQQRYASARGSVQTLFNRAEVLQSR